MLTIVQSVYLKCLINEIWYNWHLLKREHPVGKQIVALDTNEVTYKGSYTQDYTRIKFFKGKNGNGNKIHAIKHIYFHLNIIFNNLYIF